jgi:hypothetical protein
MTLFLKEKVKKSARFFFLWLFVFIVFIPCYSQVDFDQWFDNKALRIDYFLAGDANTQHFFLDDIREEYFWSGSPLSLIDGLGLGTHRVEVTEMQNGTLIYSLGFCTLFQEWQTTAEAKYLTRAFEQVTRIPFPKQKVEVSFKTRDKDGKFAELYKFEVDPSSIFINRRAPETIQSSKIVDNGHYSHKLDIAFIAEGYTREDMDKFKADVKRFADFLFTQPPFNEFADDINIWAVESISDGVGPSNPGTGYWNITATQSEFYTFGIDRYLTTNRFHRVMDIAALVPGDQVYILVNTSEYGGGGIYNHYSMATADHEISNIVFIHEFGHGLAGLGDEYYTSDVAYQDFYPLHVEPWEPNLTTLVDFKSKWLHMMDKDTPVPTPSTKEFSGKVGVFEGGGYMHKGLYRPFIDCRMKSNEAKTFCPVCQNAIRSVIATYVR